MNKRSKRLNGLLIPAILWSALFALAAYAGPAPPADAGPSNKNDPQTGYAPLGQHQSRECRVIRMLGGPLPERCREPGPEFENWRQAFTSDTGGWATSADPGPSGWCGEIERVHVDELMCTVGEIRPLSGDTYAVIRHGECNEFYSDIFPDGSAPASAFRPHNESFPDGGFVSSLNIYLDPAWEEGAGFGYAEAFQVLDEDWPNFRYVFVPVARTEAGLFVEDFQVSEAGWYTFSTVFSSEGKSLRADFVLSRHGWPLHRHAHDTTMFSQQPVASFNIDNTSNAYIWFTHISEGLDLAIDEEQMRAVLSQAGPPDSKLDDSYTGFAGMIFDIAAMPNGNILAAVTDFDFSGNSIQEIGPGGIEMVASIPSTPGSGIQGLEPTGQASFFATSAGQDLAVGAGLWHVSAGDAQFVADIGAYTLGDWPDGEPGPYPSHWKDFRCEEFAAFSHGPQTNPYHLTALSGSEMLIGDAAANRVLSADINGEIDLVALIDPPLDPDTGEWMIIGYVDEAGEIVGIGGDADGPIECYVEPVPASVAIGPDGAWYVGELTGTTSGNFSGEPTPAGLARVWRIEAGARDVVCPSEDCVEAISGLDAVIDIEFGPDGRLYVVEYERSGWLGTFVPDLGIPLTGGTLKRCDIGTGECQLLEEDIAVPGAVTFDRWANLWLLDNVFAPTIRQVDWR